jgi:hypothetical protein
MFGKKKKNQDTDNDNIDDDYEKSIGRHDAENKPRHPIRALNLGNQTYSRSGIIGIHHDLLSNKLGGKMKPMKMSGKRDIKLTLSMKTPKYDDKPMKNIKVPKAEMKEPRRFSSTLNFDYVEDHLNRMLKKRKRG